MSKPVFLVDMDGVIADFDGWLFDRSHLFPSLNVTYQERDHYFLTDNVNKEDASKMRSLVNSSRIFAELDPLPGAVAGLWALAEEADVWICTRPLEANPHCRDDKGAWLRKHFGPEFEKRMILTSDKSLVRGAVLLDDHPKQVEIDRALWRPVVYSQPFNTWRDGAGAWDAYPHYSWDLPLEDLLQWANPSNWAN